jgi:hypothetical protein
MVDRHRLIGECRKLKQDGVDLESVVAYLRDEGCWKIDCIAILREVLGISLGDAKRFVHGSSTWRDVDVREQDDTFHDEPETRKVNPPYGLWRAGAISIVEILACNHAESPMGSAMGDFTYRAMMEWCR